MDVQFPGTVPQLRTSLTDVKVEDLEDTLYQSLSAGETSLRCRGGIEGLGVAAQGVQLRRDCFDTLHLPLLAY